MEKIAVSFPSATESSVGLMATLTTRWFAGMST